MVMNSMFDAAGTKLVIGTLAYASQIGWGDMYLDGKVDEMRIYNRELSQDEINALYCSNSAGF